MENKIAGWLILHTEGRETASYELHVGKNRIGRVATANNPDIPVADDMFVSRNHAVLVVRVNDRYQYEYLLADNAEVQGKPSMNGTYINGYTTRLGDKYVFLHDGDTIQVGVTKFVLGRRRKTHPKTWLHRNRGRFQAGCGTEEKGLGVSYGLFGECPDGQKFFKITKKKFFKIYNFKCFVNFEKNNFVKF